VRSAEDIEKLIKNLDLDIDTNTTMDRVILDELLQAHGKSKTIQSALAGPNIRSIIMKSPITKLAAAAVIVIAVMLSIHLWDKSTPSAYAFIQTVEAMQGKRSFHIQTYFQQRRKDEFWAEFDEEGKLVRYRQRELDI